MTTTTTEPRAELLAEETVEAPPSGQAPITESNGISALPNQGNPCAPLRSASLRPEPEYHIRFERSHDRGLIRRIITAPTVWRMAADDGAPPAEKFRIGDHESLWYVLAYDQDELLGCFALIPETSTCWQVHTCLLATAILEPGRSLAAASGLIQWVWDNTPCVRITTRVPEFNRLALRFAKMSGMIQWGVNEMSFLKHGKLHSQVYLGITKPGVV